MKHAFEGPTTLQCLLGTERQSIVWLLVAGEESICGSRDLSFTQRQFSVRGLTLIRVCVAVGFGASLPYIMDQYTVIGQIAASVSTY